MQGVVMEGILALVLIAIFVLFINRIVNANRKLTATTGVSKQYDYRWGSLNPAYICPHCQTKGSVHTKSVKRKHGISGGKVMGGLFTLGTSLLVTGLSRKEQATQAHCTNCNSTWDF
jgi:hypothetical protein